MNTELPPPGIPPHSRDLTQVLRAARGGDSVAVSEAFQIVYEDMRAMAHARFGRQVAGSTLGATAIVHEAYLKLAGHGDMSWEDRQHFVAVASTAMRQVLVDHARRHLSLKRGGGAPHVALTEADLAAGEQARELVELDDALAQLSARDEDLARLVELRYFGGLTIEETAQAMAVSEATVKRNWRKARMFLHRELVGNEDASGVT